ncbi:MAG: class I SAM-dependent methyltransferase [Deltaproteobacteria bacterium]|nr:class I SAM-dependent methyltransferase [Deltaproteobacteria bacterium]
MPSVPFDRRPSASPAIVAIAQQERPRVITSRSRVIEIGCGDGVDAIVLAQAGAASVVGIDSEPRYVATARRRRNALELTNLTFECADLPEALEKMDPRSSDFVIGTLAFENIADEKPRRAQRLLRAIARVLDTGGRWVLHVRRGARPFVWIEAGSLLPREAQKFFILHSAVRTHLAEHRRLGSHRVQAAEVFYTVAYRRAW